MIVIPTLDIRNGSAIRPFVNGATDTPPLGTPVSLARTWATAGFRWVHVVDLDAANGGGSNDVLVEDVIRDGALDVQAVVGVESTDAIERLVDAGAGRVVLGSRALEEREWLAKVAELFPGVLVVETDVRERRVVTRGWVRSLPLDIFDVIDDLAGLSLGGLLVSAAHSDDSRGSVELALIEDIAEACDFPVMAGGAVLTMNDLRALEHRGISGVVLGSVLYSGALDPHAVAQEFSE
jgi:phosphoribosylformimino-5-aminoimidazole carboxamide ribonucleotide (ProFAR) isomerase